METDSSTLILSRCSMASAGPKTATLSGCRISVCSIGRTFSKCFCTTQGPNMTTHRLANLTLASVPGNLGIPRGTRSWLPSFCCKFGGFSELNTIPDNKGLVTSSSTRRSLLLDSAGSTLEGTHWTKYWLEELWALGTLIFSTNACVQFLTTHSTTQPGVTYGHRP